MPLSDHEVTSAREVYLSYEYVNSSDKSPAPTLWDPPRDGYSPPSNAVRAVWLVGTLPDQIEVTTDPDVVAAFLDGDD